MKKLLPFIFALLTSQVLFAKKTDTRYYEMRIYYCETGKLPDLLNRFGNHTTKLFEKHGMTNIGYWTPTGQDNNILYYILSYPSKDAREASWKAFAADPEWKTVRETSEKNGKIVAKVETVNMNLTDFSPKVKVKQQSPERVFELRTYTATANNIDNIMARFRGFTVKAFKKHGMENIAYWQTIEKDTTQSKLVYILAHKSEDAAKASFDAFRKDEKWIKVRDESEKNGKIVAKIVSVFMKPTEFSEIK